MNSALRLILPAVLALVFAQDAASQGFSEPFNFEWTRDPDASHHDMRLLADVTFTDGRGRDWFVPAGETTDGASIPRQIWAFAGSPFTGTYRRAAVIHDRYCRMQTDPAHEVHWMFNEAMQADGTSWWEALTKYAAVSVFGGGCGIESRPEERIEELRTEFSEAELGARIDDSLLARLSSFPPTPITELADPNRISFVVDLAGIERSEIFGRLVEFRHYPTWSTYQNLSEAIRLAERPDQPELDILIELARATVPAGGIPEDATIYDLLHREIEWRRLQPIDVTS